MSFSFAKVLEMLEGIAKLPFSSIGKAIEWWNDGTPTRKGERHKACLVLVTMALLCLVLAMGVMLIDEKRSRAQTQAELARTVLQADCYLADAERLKGEWFAAQAVLRLNLYEAAVMANRESVATREHRRAALGFALKAINTLTPIDARKLDAWGKLQAINHLATSCTVRAALLSESDSKRNKDEALKLVSQAIDAYKQVFTLARKQETSHIASLPELEHDARWFRTFAMTVQACLTNDQSDIGEAQEQLRALQAIRESAFSTDDHYWFKRLPKGDKKVSDNPGGGGGNPVATKHRSAPRLVVMRAPRQFFRDGGGNSGGGGGNPGGGGNSPVVRLGNRSPRELPRPRWCQVHVA